MRPSSTAPDAACFREPAYSCNYNDSRTGHLSKWTQEHEEHEELNTSVSHHLESKVDDGLYYDMSGDKILIIFNHYKYKKTRHHHRSVPRTRQGTYKDVENLEKTFRRIGFIVITHDDWKHKDIVEYLTKVCEKDHRTTSCVAVAVMTHGKGARLSAADRKYPVADITTTLLKAPALAGKPKLFFIQACRTGHTQIKPNQKELLFGNYTDCLLLYSTYEDHFSYRDSDEGSWMMQALCEVIDAHHGSMNLAQMATLVNRRVATKTSVFGKQMPVIEFNLKKFLKL